MMFTHWRQNMIVGVSILLTSLLFLILVDRPVRLDVQRTHQEMKSSRALLGEIPGHVQELEELGNRIKGTREYLEAMKPLFPSEENVDQVLSTVTELGDRSALKISRLEPMSAVSLETFSVLPFRLSAQGSYEGIATFCHALEHDERLFDVDELTLSGEKEGAGGSVELELVFVTYIDRAGK